MFSEHTWDDQQLCTLAVLEDLSRGWSRSTSFQNLKIYSHQESFVPFYFWFLPGGVHDGRKCKEEQVDWDLERRGGATHYHLCQPKEGRWCPGQGSGKGVKIYMNKHKAKINPPSDGLQCCYVARRKGTGAERTCTEVIVSLLNVNFTGELQWAEGGWEGHTGGHRRGRQRYDLSIV